MCCSSSRNSRVVHQPPSSCTSSPELLERREALARRSGRSTPARELERARLELARARPSTARASTSASSSSRTSRLRLARPHRLNSSSTRSRVRPYSSPTARHAADTSTCGGDGLGAPGARRRSTELAAPAARGRSGRETRAPRARSPRCAATNARPAPPGRPRARRTGRRAPSALGSRGRAPRSSCASSARYHAPFARCERNSSRESTAANRPSSRSRGQDHDMRVQLRVGDTVALLIPRQARRGMNELRRDQAPGLLPAQLAVAHGDAPARPRARSAQRARDRLAVRDLDLRTPIRARHRPQRGHRLRRAERHIDPRDPRPVATDPADRLPDRGERPSISVTSSERRDRPRRVETELAERVR